MDKLSIKESPLFWPAQMKKGVLRVLDETALPERLLYVDVKTTAQAVAVIRQMKTRAFGQFLVVLNTFLLELQSMVSKKSLSAQAMAQRLERTAEALNASRPTFPFSEVTSIIVAWARQAVSEEKDLVPLVTRNIKGYLMGIRQRRLRRVQQMAEVISDGDSILTHCNVSGELAMATALAQMQGKELHVFATETRPYFQGAKLTCWELKRLGVKVTLVADNAVGSLMADGLVNKVIVGSDRSCANGDFANKIGTYQMAVCAQAFKIPFYVLTQPSNKIPNGQAIPIEMRDANELLKFQGRKIMKGDVGAVYPGFDVISHELVTQTLAIDPGR